MGGLRKRIGRIETRIFGRDDLTDREAAEIQGFFEPRLQILDDGGQLSPDEWATWDRYTKRLKEAWGL